MELFVKITIERLKMNGFSVQHTSKIIVEGYISYSVRWKKKVDNVTY